MPPNRWYHSSIPPMTILWRVVLGLLDNNLFWTLLSVALCDKTAPTPDSEVSTSMIVTPGPTSRGLVLKKSSNRAIAQDKAPVKMSKTKIMLQFHPVGRCWPAGDHSCLIQVHLRLTPGDHESTKPQFSAFYKQFCYVRVRSKTQRQIGRSTKMQAGVINRNQNKSQKPRIRICG